MPVNCMVGICRSRGKIAGVSYHRLTAARHDLWMRALGRDPTKEHLCDTNRVCSLHFTDDDFILGKNGLFNLKPGAFPKRKPLASFHEKQLQGDGSETMEKEENSNTFMAKYVKFEEVYIKDENEHDSETMEEENGNPFLEKSDVKFEEVYIEDEDEQESKTKIPPNKLRIRVL